MKMMMMRRKTRMGCIQCRRECRREMKDIMEELYRMKNYDHDGNYEKQPAGRDVTVVENELGAG